MSEDIFTEVSTLKFSQRVNQYTPDGPDFLCVSPNRRFLVVGNEQNLYHFDTYLPKNSWTPIPVETEIARAQALNSGNIVLATDTGFCVCRSDGKTVYSLEIGRKLSFWADDGWILYHPSDCSDNEIRFLEIATFKETDFSLKDPPLYAWKTQAGKVRVLTGTEDSKYSIWELTPGTGAVAMLNTIRAPWADGDDFLFSLRLPTINHIHGWQDGSDGALVQLVPWAMRIDAGGNIEPQVPRAAWVLLRHDDQISRESALRATAVALENGLDPTRFFTLSMPYLVTTIVSGGVVHVVSTLWHKQTSAKFAENIDDEMLDQSMNDSDIAMLFTAESKGPLPGTENFLSSLIDKAGESRHRESMRPLFLHKYESISKMFRRAAQYKLKTNDLTCATVQEAYDWYQESHAALQAYPYFGDLLFDSRFLAFEPMRLAAFAFWYTLPATERIGFPPDFARIVPPLESLIKALHSPEIIADLLQSRKDIVLPINLLQGLVRRYPDSTKLLAAAFDHISAQITDIDKSSISTLLETVGDCIEKTPSARATLLHTFFNHGRALLQVNLQPSDISLALLSAAIQHGITYQELGLKILALGIKEPYEIRDRVAVAVSVLARRRLPESINIVAWLIRPDSREEAGTSLEDPPATIANILELSNSEAIVSAATRKLPRLLWDKSSGFPKIDRWLLAAALLIYICRCTSMTANTCEPESAKMPPTGRSTLTPEAMLLATTTRPPKELTVDLLDTLAATAGAHQLAFLRRAVLNELATNGFELKHTDLPDWNIEDERKLTAMATIQ